ncbi:unnamed protein product [Lupinus luteus]|uniref:Late nodulin domain-containing protein n=1 Tax=Lupinus luteus TaxID=3873 RepID=A0AAV1YPK9_LUPLU
MDEIMKLVYALLLLFSLFLIVTNGLKCGSGLDCREGYCPEGYVGICNLEFGSCICM